MAIAKSMLKLDEPFFFAIAFPFSVSIVNSYLGVRTVIRVAADSRYEVHLALS